MDKNTTIGLVLIGILLTVFTVINQPSSEDLKKARQEQTKTEKTEKPKAKKQPESTAENDPKIIRDQQPNKGFDVLPLLPEAPIKKIILENERLKIAINSQGAGLASVHLKNYHSYDQFIKKQSQALCLFSDNDAENFLIIPGALSTKNLVFTAKESKNKVELTGIVDQNRRVVVEYDLNEDQRLNYSVRLEGFTTQEVAKTQLKWYLNFRRTERKLKEQRKISTICYYEKDGGMNYLSETSDDYEAIDRPIEWVAFKQSYFSSILHAEKPFKAQNGKLNVRTFKEGSAKEFSHIKEMKMSLTPSFDTTNTAKFIWYFGPNEYNLLASYDADYDDILNYGWGLFRWINLYAVQPIFDILIKNQIGAGFAVLLLTLILKLILMPIQWKMFVSSVKMKILKPQIEKINKKFPKKEQAMEKQTAMMSLYRDSGASPLSGCIPMLIQMPILLAVFRFFPANFDLRQRSFLWAEDLSSYDSIWDFGFNLWPYGDHMSLFTLLMAGTTLGYTHMNSGNIQQPTQPGMPDMRIMMYIFPVLMIFFFNDYAAGLSYYYFISTLITILLMFTIKRFFVNEEKLRIKMDERSAKATANPRKKSKFQERLEEMQRKATEVQKNPKRK